MIPTCPHCKKRLGEKEWTQFFEELEAKLIVGKNRYPDSFKPPPDGVPILDIIKEWKEETIDIAGWGYVFWKRLDNLEKTIEVMLSDRGNKFSELEWSGDHETNP